jgi:parallel beta-helix repeat protein
MTEDTIRIDILPRTIPRALWWIPVLLTAGLLVTSATVVGLISEQGGENLPRDPAITRGPTVCDKYASVDGSDRADGTSSAPFRTAQKLAASLEPGQTGCLRSGTYTEADKTLTISSGGKPHQRVIIRNAPDERVRFRGRVYITEAADYVTVRNLILDGSYGPACVSSATCTVLPSPTIDGDYVHLLGNDISNRRDGSESTLAGTCVNAGTSGVRATDTLIRNNHIHDCGRLPRTNYDHGVYLTSTSNVVVRSNKIYDNADRGIQFHPDADGTLVTDNVVDANGGGVLISGSSSTTSDNNKVRNNVISNSNIRWLVESYWPDSVGSGNIVRDNCLWPTNAISDLNQNMGILPSTWVKPNGRGFVSYDNLTANPLYDPVREVGEESDCHIVYR